MNEITEPTLKRPALSGAYLAADGSGAGSPRGGEDPRRSGLALGDMFEMGLESLLMYFRLKPGEPVEARPHGEESDQDTH